MSTPFSQGLPPGLPAAVYEAIAQSPVFDGHNDLMAAIREEAGYSVEGLDRPRPEFQTDLVRLRLGGVGAQFWSAWVPPHLPEPEAVVATLEQVDGIGRLVAAYPERLASAYTVAEVRAAWAGGRIASLIGIEGGHSIARSLGVLRAFARLGVRYMTLTHTANTAWADSGTDVPAAGGLTPEGEAVVREMVRLGMLVDLSHTSAETQRAALAIAEAPVIFSHSSAFAVHQHPRNVPDDVLGRLRANGGVVLATFVPFYLSRAMAKYVADAEASMADLDTGFGAFWTPAPLPGETQAEWRSRAETQRAGGAELTRRLAAWEEAHPKPLVGIADAVAHIEHLREAAGVDHIGLGGDYDGSKWQPEGLEDVSGYPRLLAALANRGWSARDLAKLAGGNALRVLGDAEDAATDPLWPGAVA
ncbi:MAG: dipeptidase [Bifidobacteriaceae bacterium]|jgi:membrane dipeptidase|nr:dipeptidase [Bifidobacteriaceae bacterium]